MNVSSTRPVRSGSLTLGAAIVVVAASLFVAGGVGISAQGIGPVAEFFAAALQPDLNPSFGLVVATAAGITLAYAILGTAVGVSLGFVLALLTANGLTSSLYGSRLRSPRWLLRSCAAIPRSLHEVIVALLLVSILGSNPLVAVLGIGIPFAAITGKVYASFLDEEEGATLYRQLRGRGANRLAAILYGAVPSASSNMVSYGFYRFECALRSAAVLGFVGAGGLGFQLSLSFSSLRYDQIWTLLYALIIMGAAVDYYSSAIRLRRRSGQHRGLWLPALAYLLAVGLSAVWLQIDPRTLLSARTRSLAGGLLRDLWRPAFSADLVSASLQSVAIATLAILGAALLATPLSFLLARVEPRPQRAPVAGILRWLGRLGLLGLRVIPPPLWVLLSIFIIRPGVWPGVIALLIFNLGILGRLQAEVVENQSDKVRQQYRSSGATRSQAALYATIPAVWGRFVGLLSYRWEVGLRDTVLVGAVGAAGLGRILKEQISSFDYAGLSATLIVFVLLTYLADRLTSPRWRFRR